MWLRLLVTYKLWLITLEWVHRQAGQTRHSTKSKTILTWDVGCWLEAPFVLWQTHLTANLGVYWDCFPNQADEGAGCSKSQQTFAWHSKEPNWGRIQWGKPFFVKGQLLGLLNRDLLSETGRCVACPYFLPVLKRSILEIMITGFKLEVYLIENNQVPFKGISCAPVLFQNTLGLFLSYES